MQIREWSLNHPCVKLLMMILMKCYSMVIWKIMFISSILMISTIQRMSASRLWKIKLNYNIEGLVISIYSFSITWSLINLWMDTTNGKQSSFTMWFLSTSKAKVCASQAETKCVYITMCLASSFGHGWSYANCNDFNSNMHKSY